MLVRSDKIATLFKQGRYYWVLGVLVGCFGLLYWLQQTRYSQLAIPQSPNKDFNLLLDTQLAPASPRENNNTPADLFGHYYRYAYDAYKQDNFTQALSYLKEARRDPLNDRQNYQYHLLLAATFWNINEYTYALNSLKQVHTLGENTFTHLFMGMLYEILVDDAKVIYHYKRSDALSTLGTRYGYERLGDYFFKQNRYNEALAIYNEISTLKLPSAVMKIGLVNFFLGNEQITLKTLAQLKLPGRTKHLDKIYFMQALSYMQQQDYQNATQYFSKAVNIALQEEKSTYLYHWAENALFQSNYAHAAELYQETLANLSLNDAKYCEVLSALGNTYYLQAHYKNSRLFYTRYLTLLKNEQRTQESLQNVLPTPAKACFNEISVENLNVIYYLAVSLFQLGARDDAVAVLNRLSAQYELNAKMLRSVAYLKAQVYLQAKDYRNAHQAFKTFIDDWGSYPAAVYQLLELEIKLNTQNFLERYRQFTQTYETDDNFKLILAKYLESIGDYRSVIRLLKDYATLPNAKATATSNANIVLYKKIADLYVKLKEYDVALEYYNRALSLTGTPKLISELYNNQAFVYAQLGQTHQAQRLLLTAQRNHPRSVPFYYNLALLEKKLENNARYQDYLYRARLDREEENDPTLLAMVYLHSSFVSVQTYRIKHARRYLETAYHLDPSNTKIRALRNGKLLDLFQ